MTAMMNSNFVIEMAAGKRHAMKAMSAIIFNIELDFHGGLGVMAVRYGNLT
jgi:hypothetical protein